jgi:hypothetical protein
MSKFKARHALHKTIIIVAASLAFATATVSASTGLAMPARDACSVGHRFEPGPIAGSRNRQPTVREFQARIQELSELQQRDVERCAEGFTR